MNHPANGHKNLLDPSLLMLVGSFDDQLLELLQAIRLKKQDVEKFTILFNDLKRMFQKLWPGCRVMPFGSVISGLGIITSDVDCYVAVPEHLKIDQKFCVMMAKKTLQKHYQLFRELLAITAAKVPIVKLYHVPTSTYCDISFKSPQGVRNSSLLGFMLHLDRRALPLAVVLKYWAKVHQFTGTNKMSSYCLVLLIIFYLQQKNILPSVHMLQSTVSPHMIDGWNTSFDPTITHTTNNDESVYDLLGGFFEYYACFDWAKYIISPYSGYNIERSVFSNSKNVSKIFDNYIKNVEFENYEELRLNTSFCVQDFFEHNRNCSGQVYPRLAKNILTYFKTSSEIFKCSSEGEFLKGILEMQPNIVTKERISRDRIKKEEIKYINKGIVKAKHKNPSFKNKYIEMRQQMKRFQNACRK